MPKLCVFGADKLKKTCKHFGFDIVEDRGKGGHQLAIHPTIKPSHGQMPHITIPSWKEYGSAKFRSKIVRELQAYGFLRDEIIKVINEA